MYTTNKPVKRPVWKNHEIIGYVTISLEDKDFLNGIKEGFYLGFTDEEHKILTDGSEKELVQVGFIK